MKKLMIFGDSIIKGVTYNGQSYHLCQDHDFDTHAPRRASPWKTTPGWARPSTRGSSSSTGGSAPCAERYDGAVLLRRQRLRL